MSITDELREYALGWDEGNRVRRDLTAIADRIDAEHEREFTMARGEAVTELGHKVVSEYVKLPVDADGVPIRVGDTVYGCRSGMKMTISELRMTANGWSISTSRGYLTDAEVTHTRPDSWERIADDIETVVPINDEDDERLRHELADRIRRLAAKEDQR